MARWREKAREHFALLIEQSTFLFEEQRPICSQCILLNLFCFIPIFFFFFPCLYIVVYLVLVVPYFENKLYAQCAHIHVLYCAMCSVLYTVLYSVQYSVHCTVQYAHCIRQANLRAVALGQQILRRYPQSF